MKNDYHSSFQKVKIVRKANETFIHEIKMFANFVCIQRSIIFLFEFSYVRLGVFKQQTSKSYLCDYVGTIEKNRKKTFSTSSQLKLEKHFSHF